MLRVGFGFERVGLWCLAAPRLAAALVVIVSLVALVGVANIKFDNKFRNLFRTGDAQSQLYDKLVSQFPAVEDQVVLLVEGAAVSTTQGLAAIRALHLDVQWVEGVSAAYSIFSARHPPTNGNKPQLILPAKLPAQAALPAVLERLRDHPLFGAKMLARDMNATLVLVTLERGGDAVAIARAVEAAAKASLQSSDNPSALRVTATGQPILRDEILSAIRQDQIVLNLAGTMIAILLCLLYFRNARLMVVAITPGIAGVLWTVGAFGLAGQPINAMTNVLPTLVLVIAFADALHMTHAVRARLEEGAGGAKAAREAVIAVGPACAMTALTTAAVFLTLALSPSPTVREFGLAGAWAALMAFAAVITLVPTLSCLVLSPKQGAYASRKQRQGQLSRQARRVASGCARLVGAAPRAIAATGVGLLILATLGYFSVEPRYSYRDFLPDNSRANTAITTIDATMGGADAVQILVIENAKNPSGLTGLAVVRAAHGIAQGIAPLDNVSSIKNLEDWLGQTPGSTSENLAQFLRQMPSASRQRLIAAGGNAWLITAYLPAMDASQSVPVLSKLDRALDPLRAKAEGFEILVTGLVPTTARASAGLIAGLNLSLVLAIAVTMAMIGLAFKSVMLALLAAIPNLLPLAAAGSFLLISGQGLQITSVVALTVAFGIAVDDTVHLIHRWQRERATHTPRRAVIVALRKVGPVLIATTMVLGAGFAATAASGLPMVRLFGTLCVLTFVTALIADVLLLPAL
ncbi:MAG: efflux RND transporter permease subunit, partial [Alphaproteobacteria bacterium]